MPFRCPECNNPTSLHIKNSIELPPDVRSDEISLQTVKCSKCSFIGIAIYEESRRGSLDEDSFSHIGYHTDQENYSVLVKLIKNCPEPRNKKCNCKTHLKLGSKNKSGLCNGLFLFDLNKPFPIE